MLLDDHLKSVWYIFVACRRIEDYPKAAGFYGDWEDAMGRDVKLVSPRATGFYREWDDAMGCVVNLVPRKLLKTLYNIPSNPEVIRKNRKYLSISNHANRNLSRMNYCTTKSFNTRFRNRNFLSLRVRIN